MTALSETLISKAEIADASVSLADLKEQNTEHLIKLLQDGCDRDDLVKDYLKKKYRNFMNLKDRYSIGAHVVTHKYDNFLVRKECSKVLFKYCTGLGLGADDPMKMLDFNDGEIDSIGRTWNNLKAEASGRCY